MCGLSHSTTGDLLDNLLIVIRIQTILFSLSLSLNLATCYPIIKGHLKFFFSSKGTKARFFTLNKRTWNEVPETATRLSLLLANGLPRPQSSFCETTFCVYAQIAPRGRQCQAGHVDEEIM